MKQPDAMAQQMPFVYSAKGSAILRMNDYDRSNLEFLLNASPDVLKDWYDRVDQDDHLYAEELLAIYSKELEVKAALLNDDVHDISQAVTILQNLYKNK